MSPMLKLQSQIEKLERDVTSIRIQQSCTFQVVQSGLEDLNRQVEAVIKFNDSQKTIIYHLKSVVESNFTQINKHEDLFKANDAKLNRVQEIMRAMAIVLDEKSNGLELLRQSVSNLESVCQPRPVSPMMLPESLLSTEQETPRSLKGYHFGLMDIDFPATPELFGRNEHDLSIFPPSS